MNTECPKKKQANRKKIAEVLDIWKNDLILGLGSTDQKELLSDLIESVEEKENKNERDSNR